MDKKEYDRLRYIANKEKRKQQVNNYYQNNKQKIKEYQQKYSQTENGKQKINKRHREAYSKNPERIQVNNKKYRESDKGKETIKAYEESDKYKKQSKIARWKHQGIITDDFDNIHSIYMNTTNCDYCKKEFMNSLDRHLDHDHSIKDNNNIRGILCRTCNTTDVLKGCPPIF